MSECGICAYASARGCWPPKHHGTHCSRCHRSWIGLAECHCAGCCRHFGSESSFDRHLTAGGCRNPAEVRKKKGTPALVAVERRSGLVWVAPGSQERVHRLAQTGEKAGGL